MSVSALKQALSSINGLSFWLNDELCVIQHPDVGVISRSISDPYLKKLVDAMVKGTSLPLEKKEVVKKYEKPTVLEILCSSINADNPTCFKEFKKRCYQHPSFTSLDLNSWAYLLQQSRVVPKGYCLGFKSVTKELTSIYDSRFQYKVGHVAYPTLPPAGFGSVCGSGIHIGTFSFAQQYARSSTHWKSFALLAMLYSPADVIQTSDEKIRCSKALPVKVIQTKEELMSLKIPYGYIKRLSQA